MLGITDSNVKTVVRGIKLSVDAAQIRSYPKTGTTWTDLSGTGNNGTLTNGPTFNSSNGGSVVFDGTNDWVPFPNDNSLKPVDNFTVDGWFYPTVNAAGILYCKIGCYNIEYGNGSNKQIYVYGYGWSNPGYFVTNLTYELNTWWYFAVVRDSSSSSLKLWRNDTLSNTYTGINGNISCVTDIYQPAIASYSDLNLNFTGRIGIIRYYNVALSDTEINQNYNAQKSRFGL
jgi:hypothetical protein